MSRIDVQVNERKIELLFLIENLVEEYHVSQNYFGYCARWNYLSTIYVPILNDTHFNEV